MSWCFFDGPAIELLGVLTFGGFEFSTADEMGKRGQVIGTV